VHFIAHDSGSSVVASFVCFFVVIGVFLFSPLWGWLNLVGDVYWGFFFFCLGYVCLGWVGLIVSVLEAGSNHKAASSSGGDNAFSNLACIFGS